jgi:hypothetical protein
MFPLKPVGAIAPKVTEAVTSVELSRVVQCTEQIHNCGSFNSIWVRVFLYTYKNDTQDALFGGLYETRGDVTY